MMDGGYSFSKPLVGATHVVLSLGAGWQSSTLALMAARGDIGPMPTCAIFADTGAEPKAVYRYLDWLETQLPFPVIRVSAGNLREDLLSSIHNRTRVANPPFFTKSATGKEGRLRRSCTKEYKIEPIIKGVRELIGMKPRQRKTEARVEQWIGITTDEMARLKVSSVPFITHRWPLIELGMRRGQCLQWMLERQYPRPPKSACTFCPFHDNDQWEEIKSDPEEFREVVELDTALRSGIRDTRDDLFLHRSMKPISEIDFVTESTRAQGTFLDECDGMCGV